MTSSMVSYERCCLLFYELYPWTVGPNSASVCGHTVVLWAPIAEKRSHLNCYGSFTGEGEWAVRVCVMCVHVCCVCACVLGGHTTPGLSIPFHWYTCKCKSQVLKPGDESPPRLYFYFLQSCGYFRSFRAPYEIQDCSQGSLDWPLLCASSPDLPTCLSIVLNFLTLNFNCILFIQHVCMYVHLCVFEGINAIRCTWICAEDNLEASTLSFYHVHPGNEAQV